MSKILFFNYYESVAIRKVRIHKIVAKITRYTHVWIFLSSLIFKYYSSISYNTYCTTVAIYTRWTECFQRFRASMQKGTCAIVAKMSSIKSILRCIVLWDHYKIWWQSKFSMHRNFLTENNSACWQMLHTKLYEFSEWDSTSYHMHLFLSWLQNLDS